MKRVFVSDLPLLAGAARVCITPAEPVPLAGFYDRQGPFESVHDDIYARAIVFESGASTAAIVTVDICIMSDWFWDVTTDAIAAHLPIAKENVLLNASHTHGGPALYESPGMSVVDSSFMDDRSFDDLRKQYTDNLMENIVFAVETAYEKRVPARIGYGSGESFIGINRRDSSGGDMTIGVNPAGPVDRELIVIRVDNEKGAPIAVLFNLGVHGVSMMTRALTGDWCGIAAQEIEKAMDGGIVAAYLSGAAGNVNSVVLAQPCFGTGAGDAATLAAKVSDDVLAIEKTIAADAGGPVRAAVKTAILPGKRYLGLIGFDPRYDEFAKDTSPVPNTEIRMSALRVGPILFGASNAETFCEIGMEFKKKSPFVRTVFMGMTNGYASYIPSDEEMSRGGYEYNASLVKEGGHRAIVDTLLELAEELGS